MTFQDKVKFIRKKLNCSQEDLARLLSVSFATINRWEKGTYKPSKMAQHIILDFCDANGIVFDD